MKSREEPGDKATKNILKWLGMEKIIHTLVMIFSPTAIDGDGMIVALSFVSGRVHLRTRFVMSKHRAHEKEERKYLYRGQMGTHPNGIIKDTAILLKSLLTLQWPRLHYRNPSNTNVFYWGGKVQS